MKKLIIIISITLFAQYISAQSLIDIYQKGTVKLVPDKEYAQNNDWNNIFETYNDPTYGNRKSIIILPNESLVVSHENSNFYTLFDSKGKFVKEFGVVNSSGNRLKNVNPIKGIINNNFYTGLDLTGKMLCFDFEGKYIKTLTLDYMTRDMIPLSNNKFAVVGWVIWATKFRDFVAIVDYNTNEQKIIWEHFTDRTNTPPPFTTINTPPPPPIASSTIAMPLFDRPQIAFAKNRLIVTLPHSGEILIYDVNGKLISKENTNWERSYISVEEQKEIQKKAIEEFKSREMPFHRRQMPQEIQEEIKNMYKATLIKMEENLAKISEPKPNPMFATIIKDSDDNVLFFEVPEKEGSNKFNVWIYNNGGKFVGQSSFECDEYNLSITPSKMVFHNGYIYSLQTLKNADGNPLRLVRFKLAN